MKKNIWTKVIAFVLMLVIGFFGILPTPNTDMVVVYAADEEEVTPEPANLIERAISYVFLLGATGLFFLISLAAGMPLTVETLIFNKYPNTNLNIFKGMGAYNQYIGNPGISGTIGKSINDFYSFFVKIAIIAYMIILLYVGVRILLNAASEKQAKFKEYLWYWIEGLIILFFFPYIMKYTIVLNNAFVEYIYVNRGIAGTLMTQPETGGASGGMAGMESGIEAIKNTLLNGTDYMSIMFKDGWEKGWLVYAICFSVMVMQILMLLIIYFKRLLTIVFLVVCFPFVTISYAIDKLGDGKSQAFGNWYKEFALNVFTNSFHAIVYVIGMAFISELGAAGKAGKNWLLMVILLSFISKGDEMIRGLFTLGKGGGGGTVKSIGATMLKTKAAVGAVETAAGVASSMVGKDSKLAQAKNALGAVNKARLQQQVAGLEQANAEMDLARLERNAPEVGEGAELNAPQSLADAAQTALSTDATEAERDRALDQILDVMNLPDGAEKDAALAEVFENLSEDQVQELQNLLETRAAANAIMAGGLTDVELNENIEILLEQLKGNSSSEAARIARSIVGDAKNLERLRLASKMKLKKPTMVGANIANTGKKRDRTKKGASRYSGRFVQNASVQKMALARASLAPKDESLRGKMVSKGANFYGRFTRAKAQRAANRDLLKHEMKGLRDAFAGRTDSANLAKIAALRRSYADRGIYFSGLSATQKVLAGRRFVETRRTKDIEARRATAAGFKKAKRAVFTRAGRQQLAQNVHTGLKNAKENIKDSAKLAYRKTTLTANDILDQRRDIRKIRNLRKLAKSGTAADKARYNSEAEKIVIERSKQRARLKKQGVKLTRNRVESAYNAQIIRNAKAQELRALVSMTKAELRTTKDLILDGKNSTIPAYNQAKSKEAELLRSRGIMIRPPNLSESLVNRRESARARKNDREEARKEKVAARAEWQDTRKTYTYDSVKHARQMIKTAQADIDSAREEMVAAAGDPAKLEIAKRKEQVALENIRIATEAQLVASEKIRASRERLKNAGVKLALASNVDKKIQRDIEKAYQGSAKVERIVESDFERARRHAENQEALANTIELVDLRALAREKEAARQRKVAANAAQREGSMAELVRMKHEEEALMKGIYDSVQQERAVLQDAVRGIGGKIESTPKIAERLVNFAHGVVDVPNKVGDLVNNIERVGLEIGMDIHDGVSQGPQTVLGAFKELKESTKHTFGKNTEGLSLSDEIKAVAGRQEEARAIINGFVRENTEPEVILGTSPTASSPTVVVVGNSPTSSTDGKWVVAVNTPAEVDLARRNVEKAKQESAEKAKAENPNADTEKAVKLSAFEEDNLFKIACSVVALNQVDLGQYTAAEVVEHIDNIRRLEKAFPPGSEGYEQLSSILSGLKYGLDDMESNVRIQVLNDPSLIAGNDPNRGAIIDSSITYVQNMPADDVMLGTLHYDPSDLEIGYTPTSRSREVVTGIASRGFISLTEEEEASVKHAFEVASREHKLAKAGADYQEASNRLKSSFNEFVKTSADAAVDLAVGMPIAVGSGLITTGMTEDIVTGLAGYSLGDSAYKGAKKTVTNIGKKATDGLTGSKSSESKKEVPEAVTYEEMISQAIAAKRAKYEGRTSVAKSGEAGSLTERFKKYKSEKS